MLAVLPALLATGPSAAAVDALARLPRVDSLSVLRVAGAASAGSQAAAMMRCALVSRGALQWVDLEPLRSEVLRCAGDGCLLQAVSEALAPAPPPVQRDWLAAALTAAASSTDTRAALAPAGALVAAWHAPTAALCLHALPGYQAALADSLAATLPCLLAHPGWAGAAAGAASSLTSLSTTARQRGDCVGASCAAAAATAAAGAIVDAGERAEALAAAAAACWADVA